MCVCASVRENGRKKADFRSLHKKGGRHGNSLSFFYPIVCYIYLLNVFWGFGSFTVVDSP